MNTLKEDRTNSLNYYNRELLKHRLSLVKNISKLVNPLIVERFITIFLVARYDDSEEALELGKLFDFDEMDIAALSYDLEIFKECYMSRQENEYCQSAINL